jgi:DNA-binding CsgD family transcriptional regulator
LIVGEKEMKDTESEVKTSISLIRKMIEQAAKERGLSMRLNAGLIILAYFLINSIIFLVMFHSNILSILFLSIAGLAALIFLSYYRERMLNKRQNEFMTMALISLNSPENEDSGLEKQNTSKIPLTARELEILSFVAIGGTDKLVAARLGLSESTVKNHLRSVYTKLEVNDRTSAVLLALRFGWLKIPAEGQMNISSYNITKTNKNKLNHDGPISPVLNHETPMET